MTLDKEDGRASKLRQQVFGLLGIALRARKIVMGQEAVMAAIRGRSAQLVMVAADAGSNAAKKYRDKCAFYDIGCLIMFDRMELGRACGRGQLVALAVTDPGFAASLRQYAGEISGGEAFDETSSV